MAGPGVASDESNTVAETTMKVGSANMPDTPRPVAGPNPSGAVNPQPTARVGSDFDWVRIVTAIVSGAELSPADAKQVVTELLSGDTSAVHAASVLTAIATRGPRAAELASMVDAMLEAAAPLTLPSMTIDIVGTGGASRRRTKALNVSTAACFVAASAGATVCKHGNRRASSTSGSTDVLEELGLEVELGSEAVGECVATTGLGFAFARVFHPAMRHVGPIRAQLGFPTVFNLLGPLAHPGRVARGVVGVADANQFELISTALQNRRPELVWVVFGTDGVDELSTSDVSRVAEIRGGNRRDFELSPQAVGLERVDAEELRGGDPGQNAALLREAFSGVRSHESDLIALNAAAGLVVAGVTDDLVAGVERCQRILESGEVADRLAALVDVTRRLGAG